MLWEAKNSKLQGHVSSAHTWAVYEMVAETMLLVVKQSIIKPKDIS
jgi:hypothetical protein